MAEFDKTKKAIGVGGMAENERNDMLNKFKSAGGKVVREKEDKPQQQPRNTQKMKALGGKDEKSKSSSSGSGSEKNVLGVMTDVWVYDDDGISDVDVVGTHACLFRRDMLLKMLGDNDPKEYEWFYYPRNREMSEDVAFSLDAKEMGFKLGATTHVKTGHLASLNVTWDSYHDYLHASGKATLIQRYQNLASEIAGFTGEDPDLVVAKSIEASRNVKEPWLEKMPKTADEVRAFYGASDNGYLYELLHWNCQPLYQRIIDPLAEHKKKKVLVIGSGLGVEAELLAQANGVCVFVCV